MDAIGSQFMLSFSSNVCKAKALDYSYPRKVRINERFEIVCRGMLAPRKFMRRTKKVEVFKDAADEADQKNWRRLMTQIEESGSAVSILRSQRINKEGLPRDLVLGTLKRFKQLKKWNIVSEILEWLRCQHWWDFNEMDFLMLITAYGKLGDFNKAERVLKYMNGKSYPPSVISHTALMEAYGRAGQHNKAEAIFRRMQLSGPEPSPLTYQIILKAFVEGDKFHEAEAIFDSLLKEERSTFKPDQKMFHMMIYMHKKAGNYDQARRTFAQMAERGIPQSTVTFNSLMSFETNYKEVSKIYDQMQRAGHRPDVVSYGLLINAYGKSRRQDEALAVFEEMLDAGVRPTRKAYNILLDAFAISGMVEEARTVLRSMRRDKCSPDLCSYATMISAYANASDMAGAERYFLLMKQDDIKPNVVIYGTLMKGYAKANNLEKVMQVYERMRMEGIEGNRTVFTTIMDAHGKNSDFGSATIWYKEMNARGLEPDQKAKNILLSLAKTAEEQKEANELAGNAEEQKEANELAGNVVGDLTDFCNNAASTSNRVAIEVKQTGADLNGGIVSEFDSDEDNEDGDIDDDDEEFDIEDNEDGDIDDDDEEVDIVSYDKSELVLADHLPL